MIAHAEVIVTRILVRQAAERAATVDALRELARAAVKAGAWTEGVRATFTRCRERIEGRS